MTVVSVLEIGGTHVTAADVAIDSRGVGQMFREPLDSDGSAEEIVSTLARCAARLPARPGARWSVAVPGPFDYEGGIGQFEGVGKFEALRGFDLRAALTSLLPSPAGLSFHNDAHAFALGEWWAGAARGHRSAVGITLGTGVGSGFVLDGQVRRSGPGVPPDGRLDLVRHAGLPLEETVSRRAIRRAYADAVGAPPELDVREIADRARQGDRAAAEVFTRTFHVLGAVLGPLLADFGATVVVVGGSIAASWDLVAPPLGAGLGAGPVVLTQAHDLTQASLLGAAYLATATPATPAPGSSVDQRVRGRG